MPEPKWVPAFVYTAHFPFYKHQSIRQHAQFF